MNNDKIEIQVYIKTKTNKTKIFNLLTRAGTFVNLTQYFLENARLFLKIRKYKQNARVQDDWQEFDLDDYSATQGRCEWDYDEDDTDQQQGIFECEIEGNIDLVNDVFVKGTSSRQRFPESENQFIYIEFQKGSL